MADCHWCYTHPIKRGRFKVQSCRFHSYFSGNNLSSAAKIRRIEVLIKKKSDREPLLDWIYIYSCFFSGIKTFIILYGWSHFQSLCSRLCWNFLTAVQWGTKRVEMCLISKRILFHGCKTVCNWSEYRLICWLIWTAVKDVLKFKAPWSSAI